MRKSDQQMLSCVEGHPPKVHPHREPQNMTSLEMGFPGVSDGTESTCNYETCVRSLGRENPLEEGNGNPLQYSCLENSKDRGAWWTTVHGITESQTQLSD